MTLTIENRYSGLKHHAKVHSFRVMTVILAWVLIAAAFYEKPELLTGPQRTMQRGMETVAIAFRVHGVRELNLSLGKSAASSGCKLR